MIKVGNITIMGLVAIILLLGIGGVFYFVFTGMASKGDFNLSYTSMEVETSHVKWIKPYYRGKVKAIILTEGYLQRDVIELAQRMDLDFDTTYLYPFDLKWGQGDYIGTLRTEDIKAGLERVFKENPEWEVLIITGPLFRLLWTNPPSMSWMQRDVMKKVEKGAGLVVIEPGDIPPLHSMSPISPVNIGTQKLIKEVKWEKVKEHFITTGIPFSVLPATDIYEYKLNDVPGNEVLVTAGGKPLLAVSEYGKGRIAAFTYRGGTIADDKDRPCGLLPLMSEWNQDLAPESPGFKYFEYQFSLLAKAVLWAAGKEPGILIDEINANSDGLRLVVNNKEKMEEVYVELKVQDEYGDMVVKNEEIIRISPEKNELKLSYTATLPSGLNLIDIQLKDNKGAVINWASASIEIEQPISISKIDVDKAFYNPGDEVRVQVRLNGELRSTLFLKAEVVDGFDRVIAKDIKRVDSKTIIFNLPLNQPLNYLFYIKVSLNNNEELWDTYALSRSVVFPLKENAHTGDPNLVVWSSFVGGTSGFNNYIWPYLNQRLSNIGVTGTVFNSYDRVTSYLESCLKNNIGLIVKHGGIGGKAMPKDESEHPVREPDVLIRPSERSGATSKVQSYLSYGATELMGGDENRFAHLDLDVSFSPYSLIMFREWLKGRYPSLEALNNQWGTSFKDWHEVKPFTLKETKVRGDNNFSSWSEHRAFNEFTFANYFGNIKDGAEDANPNFRMGISGTQQVTPYYGYDYWLLSKTLTSMQCYFGVDELVSFADERFDIRKWGGYGQVGSTGKFYLYDHFFRGGTGYNIWCSRLLFSPDMTYSKLGKTFEEHYAPIKNGLGRLLIESDYIKQPIGIHYSQKSCHVAYALDEFYLWKASREGFQKLAENSGFDIKHISYEQIEDGELKNIKVLYLPCSYSLSDKEVVAIKEFVRNGGLLISQMGTGMADGYGKVYKDKGSLDEVLGIRRTNYELIKRNGRITSTSSEHGFNIPEVPVKSYETGISATTAKVLAQINKSPVAFLNSYGEGKALYLACDIFPVYSGQTIFSVADILIGYDKGAFNSERNSGSNSKYAYSVEEFLKDILGTVGLKERVIITDPKGQPVPFVKVSLFEKDDIQYFAIIRDYDLSKNLAKAEINVEIKFPISGYIYEIMEDESYGFTDSVKTIFGSDTVKVYSVLPYKVDDIKVSMGDETFQRGSAVQYQITVGSNENVSTHTLRMEVFDPEGQLYTPYCENITATSGEASGYIPLAFNDKVGDWSITIRDLTSGSKTTLEFTVK